MKISKENKAYLQSFKHIILDSNLCFVQAIYSLFEVDSPSSAVVALGSISEDSLQGD